MIAADGVRALAIGSSPRRSSSTRSPSGSSRSSRSSRAAARRLFAPRRPGALRAVVPRPSCRRRRRRPAAGRVSARRPRRSAARFSWSPGASVPGRRGLLWVLDSLVARRCARRSSRSASRTASLRRAHRGLPLPLGSPVPANVRVPLRAHELHRPGLLLAVVVIGKEQGLSGGEVGLRCPCSAPACCSVRSCRRSSAGCCPSGRAPARALGLDRGARLFSIWPNVYVLTASILPTALAIPSTDSVVIGHRLAMTPDRLLGRVESVRARSRYVAPLGPLTAGLLLDAVSARATIAVFASAGLVLALWGTLSPSIRAAPSLDELKSRPHSSEPRRSCNGDVIDR